MHFALKRKSFLIPLFPVLTSCNADFAWHVISPANENGRTNLNFLVGGYRDTILLSVSSISISVVLGLFLALAGFSRNLFVKGSARSFIAFFRAVPLVALILWVFYGLPIFLGVNLGPFASGIIALVLGDAAFEAEIFRAGIQSVSKGQKEAAMSMGMKTWYVYRLIIIPQAIRKILPALGNQFVYILKMSAIVSIIGLTELTKKANELVVSVYRPLEIYSILVLEYLVLIILVSGLVRMLEKKMKADSLKYG